MLGFSETFVLYEKVQNQIIAVEAFLAIRGVSI
jgi:hypothetical protein